MPQFKPMDPNFPIQQQLGIATEPVVLVNVFTLDPQKVWRGRYLHRVSSRANRGNPWHRLVSCPPIANAQFSTENVGKLVDILRTATLNP